MGTGWDADKASGSAEGGGLPCSPVLDAGEVGLAVV